jgi:hypothetical protein
VHLYFPDRRTTLQDKLSGTCPRYCKQVARQRFKWQNSNYIVFHSDEDNNDLFYYFARWINCRVITEKKETPPKSKNIILTYVRSLYLGPGQFFFSPSTVYNELAAPWLASPVALARGLRLHVGRAREEYSIVCLATARTAFPPCELFNFPALPACLARTRTRTRRGHHTRFLSTAMPRSSGRASPAPRARRSATTGPQEREENEAEEVTRRRTSRNRSSSQGSATGPGAAGKPYSSSACRSSSRNAGWLRCASRTTNRLGAAAAAGPCTDTATCPAGTAASGEDDAASAARDRHRRSARRSQTSDGIVNATLHMMLGGLELELLERPGCWVVLLLFAVEARSCAVEAVDLVVDIYIYI